MNIASTPSGDELVPRGMPSFRWRYLAPAVCALVCLVLVLYYRYARSVQNKPPHGGSTSGIVFGVIAAVSTGLLMLYPLRKGQYRASVGTLQTWFWSHVWISVVALAAFLLHTGFHVRGIANWLLAIVFVGEIGSGAFGLCAYSFIRQQLVATETVALFGESLQHYVEELEKQLIALRPEESTSEAKGLAIREELNIARRAHRMNRLLRGWIPVHAFLAVILLPMLALHIVASAYYR